MLLFGKKQGELYEEFNSSLNVFPQTLQSIAVDHSVEGRFSFGQICNSQCHFFAVFRSTYFFNGNLSRFLSARITRNIVYNYLPQPLAVSMPITLQYFCCRLTEFSVKFHVGFLFLSKMKSQTTIYT